MDKWKVKSMLCLLDVPPQDKGVKSKDSQTIKFKEQSQEENPSGGFYQIAIFINQRVTGSSK